MMLIHRSESFHFKEEKKFFIFLRSFDFSFPSIAICILAANMKATIQYLTFYIFKKKEKSVFFFGEIYKKHIFQFNADDKNVFNNERHILCQCMIIDRFKWNGLDRL